MSRTHTLPRKVQSNEFIGAAAAAVAEPREQAAHYTSAANAQAASPVGFTVPSAEQQYAKGHEARGWALAETIIAISGVSLARDLARCVMTAFNYDVTEREAAGKRLRQWVKECKINAEANGNLAKSSLGGDGGKALRRMASSATTRASQFNKILSAMNGGMTQDTLKSDLGIDDLENVGFDVFYAAAMKFLPANASGRGRPTDPWQVKLYKWLQRNAPAAEEDKDVVKLAEVVKTEVETFLVKHPLEIVEA